MGAPHTYLSRVSYLAPSASLSSWMDRPRVLMRETQKNERIPSKGFKTQDTSQASSNLLTGSVLLNHRSTKPSITVQHVVVQSRGAFHLERRTKALCPAFFKTLPGCLHQCLISQSRGNPLSLSDASEQCVNPRGSRLMQGLH